MPKLQLSSYTLTTALGRGLGANTRALLQCTSGLRPHDLGDTEFDTWIGRVEGIEEEVLPDEFLKYDCRNNRLAYLGMQQDDFIARAHELVNKYGADRVGVFMGTSTSGIQVSELAYAQRKEKMAPVPKNFEYEHTHATFSLGKFVHEVLGTRGPVQVISTACSSSAKVFAAAQRYINAGFCDAAIVGGVDSLCQMTLYGFNSLQLISSQKCRPADENRDGINIGEAAGFAILEPASATGDLYLLGYGESSDAHHMSTPHPEGAGAALAIRTALTNAGLQPEDIDYINLHGTATQSNDLSEDKAITSVFREPVPCSSTKGYVGHTLGAAGIVEAIFSCLAIENNAIWPSLNTELVDNRMQSSIQLSLVYKPVHRVLTNSFGFGGNNASLIIGSAP